MSFHAQIKPAVLAVLGAIGAVGVAHGAEQTLPQITVQGLDEYRLALTSKGKLILTK